MKNKKVYCFFDPDLAKLPADKAMQFGVYAVRAMALAGGGDVVLLPEGMQGMLFETVSRHFQRLGFGTPEIVWYTPENTLDILREHINAGYEPCIFKCTVEYGEMLGMQEWPNVVQLIDSKNKFALLCAKLNISTPRTWGFTDGIIPKNVPFELRDMVVKPEFGVSGSGIKRVTQGMLGSVCKAIRTGVIQEFIQYKALLGVTFEVACRSGSWVAEQFAISEQMMGQSNGGNFAHSGSIFPCQYSSNNRIWQDAQQLSDWLVAKGMRGKFGFDVLIDNNGQHHFLECNPRETGSTIPATLAGRVGAKAWQSMTIPMDSDQIESFIERFEFDPEKQLGVTILNWGTIVTEGKVTIVVCGNSGGHVKSKVREIEEWHSS